MPNLTGRLYNLHENCLITFRLLKLACSRQRAVKGKVLAFSVFWGLIDAAFVLVHSAQTSNSSLLKLDRVSHLFESDHHSLNQCVRFSTVFPHFIVKVCLNFLVSVYVVIFWLLFLVVYNCFGVRDRFFFLCHSFTARLTAIWYKRQRCSTPRSQP